MPGFDELQALWQAQAPRAVSPAEVAELRAALRDYGRRINRVYVIKAAVIPVIVGYFLVFSHPPRAAMAALVGVLFVAATILAADWRSQNAIAHLDFTTVSRDFVRDTIQRLSAQCDPFGRRYWLIVAAVAIFENVWVSAFPHQWTWISRLLTHGLVTVLPIGALELGRRVRLWRFRREGQPLIDRLSAIEKSLQEDIE